MICPPPCRPVCNEPCQPCPPPCRPVCCPPACNPVCPQPCQPVCCPPPCKPVCPPPCKPVCNPPACPAPCQPRCAQPCEPVCPRPCPQPCPPPCKPQCAPCQDACPPMCAAPLKPCKFGPTGECCCNGVTVTARNPKMCILGDQYPLDLEITACCNVCEVVLTTTLPEGVTYMRSQPEAHAEGRNIVWQFGSMTKGQTICARIWLKSEREGDLCTCFCVRATPVAFCALLCAKPVLLCEKCGPAEVCPGDPIHYTITVTNVGTCAAEDVVVTDNLPEGVEHASGQRTLNFKLGTLERCQSKKVNLCVTACRRGQVCNTAIVSACNANQTSCEFCTCVCCCAIECQKVGPKEVPIGQNADYQITVVNTGDKVLHEVVITDTAPSATSIVAAPGANISGKQAVWKLRELKPGETVTFNLTLTTCTPGYFVNGVHITTCEGCNSCCEFGTHWKGRPALDVCITNSDNPICVNETSRFKIVVSNKGQEYDSNVNVVVNFPPELAPVNASGASAAQLNGQTVTFAPFPNLAPRQTLEYYVTVKATGRGDLRPKVQISSDFIKNPITQEESLIVN
ncbi:MAG: DUF11 domain-containing protein [Candidatus Protochlamydia sp.]|nr:DUF11 domain-containing protein [Candidatus Protochlamydia sp.]